MNRDCVSVMNENFLHPSAQVRNYCNYLKYYHESFTEFGLNIYGCSFLHNMTEQRSISLLNKIEHFSTLPREYPIFTKNETDKFRLFLHERLNKGKGKFVSQKQIEGKIKPSTKLLDVVDKAINSNF